MAFGSQGKKSSKSYSSGKIMNSLSNLNNQPPSNTGKARGSNPFRGKSVTEDRWMCCIVMTLVAIMVFLFVYSMRRANEEFKKSPYFIHTNNYLF